MSAFPESGRSDCRKTAVLRVRFRPEADIRQRAHFKMSACIHQRSANTLGITYKEMTSRLARGHSELLTLILAAPLGAWAYRESRSLHPAASDGGV